MVRVIGMLLLLYYVELIFWPYDLGARAVMPLVPFLCFGLVEGLKQMREQPRRWLAGGVSLVLLVGFAPSAYTVAAVTSHPPDIHRADEVKSLSIWTKENVSASARVATHVDWFKSDFPMMHFVAWSGHKLTQTKGESLGSIARRADYLLFEAFPTARTSIELPEPGAVGRVVYRTPFNTFQVVQVVRSRAATTAK
jgi:hypothetical protein